MQNPVQSLEPKELILSCSLRRIRSGRLFHAHPHLLVSFSQFLCADHAAFSAPAAATEAYVRHRGRTSRPGAKSYPRTSRTGTGTSEDHGASHASDNRQTGGSHPNDTSDTSQRRSPCSNANGGPIQQEYRVHRGSHSISRSWYNQVETPYRGTCQNMSLRSLRGIGRIAS